MFQAFNIYLCITSFLQYQIPYEQNIITPTSCHTHASVLSPTVNLIKCFRNGSIQLRESSPMIVTSFVLQPRALWDNEVPPCGTMDKAERKSEARGHLHNVHSALGRGISKEQYSISFSSFILGRHLPPVSKS